MNRTFLFVLSAILVAVIDVHTTNAQEDSITEKEVSGPVTVTVSLQPQKPVIGDTLTLRIEVIAEPEVEVLMPDFGEALDRFSIIDFAPRDSVEPDGKRRFIQTYRMDAPSSGRLQIPPILIEYVDRRDGQQVAPEGLDAYEVLTDRIVFEVESVLPQDVEAELKPALGKLKPLERREPRKGSIWIVTAVILLVAIPFAIRLFRHLSRRARRRSAFDVAESKLKKLLLSSRSTPQEIKHFYVKLSLIVRRYIEDRYDLRAPELTTEEFLISLQDSAIISRDHQQLLGDFLKGADLVKFAKAHPSTEDTEHSIDSVRRFLVETRENAPMLESDPSVESEEAVDE